MNFNCPKKCERGGSFSSYGCDIKCSECDFICQVDGCIIKGGCDAIAIGKGKVLVIEAKSGRVSREDAKDAARQLKECLDRYFSHINKRKLKLILLHGKRLDKPARIFLQKECELRKQGFPVDHVKCGTDLSKYL